MMILHLIQALMSKLKLTKKGKKENNKKIAVPMRLKYFSNNKMMKKKKNQRMIRININLQLEKILIALIQQKSG